MPNKIKKNLSIQNLHQINQLNKKSDRNEDSVTDFKYYLVHQQSRRFDNKASKQRLLGLKNGQ